MILSYVIMIISFIFDGILSLFLPFMVNDLSLFTPLLTLVSLIIVYPIFSKSRKQFFILAVSVGLLYDLFYTNLLFFNALLFLMSAIIIIYLYKYIPTNFISILLYTLIIIVIYEVVTALIFMIFNLVPITFTSILYKIDHSLILNFIWVEVFYLLLKFIPKKYVKLAIN